MLLKHSMIKEQQETILGTWGKVKAWLSLFGPVFPEVDNLNQL